MSSNEPPAEKPAGLSRPVFWGALILLLLPAAIPVYFAFAIEEGTALFLGGALGLAAINLSLLFALSRWVKTLHE